LIGDTRRHKHYVPLAVRVLEQFLDVGFIFREDVTGLQHRMKGTREKWRGRTYDFYPIAHEHLYVFWKPAAGEDLKEYRHSVKWRWARRHPFPYFHATVLNPPVYTTIHMARVVQLSDEAYARLATQKGEGESYSDVVLRLSGKKDPLKFVGRLKVREDYDEIMAAMRRAETRSRRRLRA
jgi:predicted CopG family antitoxin